jgi:hypothetical protein
LAAHCAGLSIAAAAGLVAGESDEPELHLGRDVVVPDIGGWRRERLPQLPADARV